MSVCFYKRFCFFGKHLKNVKLSFTNIFQKLYLLFKFLKLFFACLLLYLLAFKSLENFYYLLSGFALLLKSYKLLFLACLEVYKTSHNFSFLLALSYLKSFLKPFTNLCFKRFSKLFHKNESLGINRML